MKTLSLASTSAGGQGGLMLILLLTHGEHGMVPWNTSLSGLEVEMQLRMSKMSDGHDVEQSSPNFSSSRK